MSKENNKEQQIAALREAALQYHEFPTPGKIEIAPTKQLTNPRDLALAYKLSSSKSLQVLMFSILK